MDVSQSVEHQNEQIQYWIRYLKTHLQNSDDLSIIIVGNRIDQIEDEKLRNKGSPNLESLKQSQLIYDYVMISAKQVIQIQNLLDILRRKCLSLLSKPENFMIPKLYKLTAERLQSEKKFLIGIFIFIDPFIYFF